MDGRKKEELGGNETRPANALLSPTLCYNNHLFVCVKEGQRIKDVWIG
jgi:hypothetical protein